MALDFAGQVIDDGHVALEWAPHAGKFKTYWLLAMRTGAKPGFTTLELDGNTYGYRFANLGRHQRYRFAVLAARDGAQVCSPWLSATPRAGSTLAREDAGVTEHLAKLKSLVAMPQDKRITLYWMLGPGFVDRVSVEIRRGIAVLGTYELEPEVKGFTIDPERCRGLLNGTAYTVTARAKFALAESESRSLTVTPAPQGQERDANRNNPQLPLVYPCLSLAPELDVFGDAKEEPSTVQIVCGRCRGRTEWRDYNLRCRACNAEFIANQRGDYLDVTKLRFGTCRCCLPRKLLVQDVGSTSLRCVHSGKEHIRAAGLSTFMLIEDLPHGLCQCCRPRRPLERKADDTIRCSKSNELHNQGERGGFGLVPSAPVFDAAAIDELLDAGLADICANGVSRGRR